MKNLATEPAAVILCVACAAPDERCIACGTRSTAIIIRALTYDGSEVPGREPAYLCERCQRGIAAAGTAGHALEVVGDAA